MIIKGTYIKIQTKYYMYRCLEIETKLLQLEIHLTNDSIHILIKNVSHYTHPRNKHKYIF